MPLMLPNAPAFTLYESNIQATPSTTSLGTGVTNPVGAANTKNTTWTELITSTAFDAQLIIVTLGGSNASNTNTSTLIDIGIGAASSESVIIPDLLGGYAPAPTEGFARASFWPIYIPAGSRLSARSQSVRTSGLTRVLVQLYGAPRHPDAWWCGKSVTAYGINTADSGAVAVTAGNSGAETASPVSIGTTSADHQALVFMTSPNSNSTTTLAYHFDVGIDTASTEWLIRDAFHVINLSTEISGQAHPHWPIFRPIPSGTVLVAGGECSGTGESMDIALYGIS